MVAARWARLLTGFMTRVRRQNGGRFIIDPNGIAVQGFEVLTRRWAGTWPRPSARSRPISWSGRARHRGHPIGLAARQTHPQARSGTRGRGGRCGRSAWNGSRGITFFFFVAKEEHGSVRRSWQTPIGPCFFVGPAISRGFCGAVPSPWIVPVPDFRLPAGCGCVSILQCIGGATGREPLPGEAGVCLKARSWDTRSRSPVRERGSTARRPARGAARTGAIGPVPGDPHRRPGRLRPRATVNLLNEWMDPRHIQSHGMGEPSDEELDRPMMWRFWRALPPRGKIGVFLGSSAAPGRSSTGCAASPRPPTWNRAWSGPSSWRPRRQDEGALIIKFWLHLSKEKQEQRLKSLEKNPLTRWRGHRPRLETVQGLR